MFLGRVGSIMSMRIEKKTVWTVVDEINGNESPNPTPAAHIIDPINITSNIVLRRIFLMFKIPENVREEFGFLVIAKPNATTGRQ